MDPTFLLIALLAIGISTISIIAGLGGGVLLIPILTIFFDIPIKTVVGTVLLSLVAPATIGTIGAWRRGNIDFKLGLLFELPTATGAYFGAKIVYSVPEWIIESLFGILALFLSIQMIKNTKTGKYGDLERSKFWRFIGTIKPTIILENTNKAGVVDYYSVSITSLIIGGLTIGTLAGMLGVGGGWIKTPLMILGFGVPPIIATGTSIFMITITATSGGISHLINGSIQYPLLYALVSGLSIGAIFGNFLKARLKSYQITYIIGSILFVVSVIMIISIF